MTSLKMTEDSNNLSQPFLLPNSRSQEETKATDTDLSNAKLPKVPSQSFQSSIFNDPDESESVKINSRQNPSITNPINKKIPSQSEKLPYLILHPSQETKREDVHSSKKTPPFVITQYLGPFIPPEGTQEINVDRLMPYLEFVTTIYEKSFKGMSFRLYQAWLCLYPVITLCLMTTIFRYFEPNWDTLEGLVMALAIICEMYSIYQAYQMFKIIKNQEKKRVSWMIVFMAVYGVVNILILEYFWHQSTPSDTDRARDLQIVIISHLCALIAHILLTLVPAFWVKRAIGRFHRFIFLKNNLQDPEKTGIYYQYVFELLYMISEKGLLYPIKAPKDCCDKKSIRKGIVQAFADGFHTTHLVPE